MDICHLRSESQGGRFDIQYTQYVYAIILLCNYVNQCSLINMESHYTTTELKKKKNSHDFFFERQCTVENVWEERARVLCPCDAEYVQVI